MKKLGGTNQEWKNHITRICTGNLKIFKFYKAFTNVIVILHKENKREVMKKCEQKRHRENR